MEVGRRFWLGKLKEHPEIMTQGQTLSEEDALLDKDHDWLQISRICADQGSSKRGSFLTTDTWDALRWGIDLVW